MLTSKGTSSGGEELAYYLQPHKLGKVIGEITRGGANPAGPVDLGDGIIAVPQFDRTEDLITKSNWEGRGVRLDVRIPSRTRTGD
ncbi:S41 family peptidase [Sphingomonas sp. BK069]|uniref:S41 family peptidase n=1 Tax=Sphingomonas sp. BK069 TaxID=2586979 RepID=UPI00161A7D6E